MATESNNWNEWRTHVLSELKRLDKNDGTTQKVISDLSEAIGEKFDRLHVDIITLKVKSGVWGAGAGMLVGAFISALISFVFQAKP